MKRANSSGRVAIVTGAGKRMGRAIALALAKNGFHVVVNYMSSSSGAREVVKSIEQIGGRAIAVKADISKKREVESMVRKTITTFGRIDLLVNNAGVFIHSPLMKTTEVIWNHTMDINLKGMFLCSQEVASHMLKQQSGSIINIASIGGIQAFAKHVPYSVSKAGAIMLTKCLAKELAPHIMVNAIAPGTILFDDDTWATKESLKQANILLNKYGNPSDITNLVMFLASTSKYITGQIITVDGGVTVQ